MGGCDWEGTDVVGKGLMKGIEMVVAEGKKEIASKIEEKELEEGKECNQKAK
jgi:4-aminobutyrate aminotransferase-like enzyme